MFTLQGIRKNRKETDKRYDRDEVKGEETETRTGSGSYTSGSFTPISHNTRQESRLIRVRIESRHESTLEASRTRMEILSFLLEIKGSDMHDSINEL